MKITFIIPVYNEAGNIETFLKSIDELNLDLDVLLIDDSSPDNTKEIIQNYMKDKKNINLIVRNKKEGLDTAHKLAYEYSLKHSYRYLITLDSDMSHDPKKIPEFLAELKMNSFVGEKKRGQIIFKAGVFDIGTFRMRYLRDKVWRSPAGVYFPGEKSIIFWTKKVSKV